jgi:26S proteasome regulatory subunit N1
MLGRQQIFLDLEEEGLPDYDVLYDLISNSHLNTNFVALAREVIICTNIKFVSTWLIYL